LQQPQLEIKEMSSFTVGKKLYIGVGALMVLTFALGFTALVSIRSGGERVRSIADDTFTQLSLAQSINIGISYTMAGVKGILMRGLQHDPAGIQRNVDDFHTFDNTIQNNIKQMRSMQMQPQVASALNDIEDATNQYRITNDKLLQKAVAGDMDGSFDVFNNELKPLQIREQKDVDQMIGAQADNLSRTKQEAQTSANIGFWLTGTLLALSSGLCIAFAFVIRQINSVLHGSVIELAESAVQITSAANQVSSSSQSLAQGSSEQAATIEETSSVSTEINSMAQRNTENSRSTADLVTRSQDGFARTNQSLTEMVDAMDGINASSQKISKIIKVIDEIAFQTNILALNAAVEAARAGEAGMGFAVVADEVRNLAQRCAQAAKDTADLIEESIDRSNGGKLKVDEVAVAIRAITEESGKIKVLVDEINLGSIEQSRGIDQIARSITQMEQVTQSNAANAEESAAAAEELNAQAEAMKDIVKTLKAMVDGGEQNSGTDRKTPPRLQIANAMPVKPKALAPLAKSVTRVKSVVQFREAKSTTPDAKIAKPVVKSANPVREKIAVSASSEFPMDDDFKEF
jgi:methyl-accepting chemotaxis protein/methyl-accepting chemotaxis protein-1 (serine sensor receptor)